MTLFFDTKVQFLDSEAISTVSTWHPIEPVFAVASFSNDRGGSVTIFDDTGVPLRDVSFPVHPTSQATVLTWHPEFKILVTGWENGELYGWFEGKRDFATISGPHKSPITALEFSEKGGRMVTADSMGVLTGWRFDGQSQFLTMFNHDLRDPLLHITFRKSIQSASSMQLTNLARAAVAGDEAALDQLTSWRPRTAVRNFTNVIGLDNYCFYACTQAGILYYINQAGTCTEILRGDSIPIRQILWHPKQDSIVILMEDISIGHYEVDGNGQIAELDRVKFSAQVSSSKSAITWVTNSALAILTGDLTVRIWDIETNDSYVLSMEPTTTFEDRLLVDGVPPALEAFTCVAYCADSQTLSAGTNQGHLYIWRRITGLYEHCYTYSEIQWHLTNVTPIPGTIKSLLWGRTETNWPCMIVNCLSNVFVLKEQSLLSAHARQVWATQKKCNELLIRNANGREVALHSDISIVHMALNELNLVVTNGRTVAVYKIDDTMRLCKHYDGGSAATNGTDDVDSGALVVSFVDSFVVECVAVYLYQQKIVTLGSEHVQIFSLNGIILKEIIFSGKEGKPIGVDLVGSYLTVFTLHGFIRVYDVSRHEIRLLHPPKNAFDLIENFGEIIMLRTNANGNFVAMTIANEHLLPDGKLYLLNLESNVLTARTFQTNEIIGRDQLINNSLREVSLVEDAESSNTCLPVGFFWDVEDHRLLACETKLRSRKHEVMFRSLPPESQIHVMFVDGQKSELAVLEMLDHYSEPKDKFELIGLCIPHVIVLWRNEIARLPLRDFKGLDTCDMVTREMILNFSLNVAQENMDQAFSCIRSLRSETVWANLARLCVHTGRLDVAKVCLGHLRRARSVRAMRLAMEDANLEQQARVAVLAIELDMIEEAKSLYKRCGRYDLLNKLYQASGKYEEALEVAEHFDRVHLKNTYHRYAVWMKECGDTQEALHYYERTPILMHSICQLLMDDLNSLKQYMQRSNNSELLRWWAQYVESSGDMEGAFQIYQRSGDWFSQVRILCFIGQVGRADNIASGSGDRAACYHLGRYYENSGKLQEAIQFYTRAQTYGNAVRICKENELPDDLWTIACIARPRDKASAAAYFEESNNYQRAVELYHRAGMLHKAVEMAFRSQQPETLQVITSELDATSDPDLLRRCAEFFLGIHQPYKAVQLLANARQLTHAIALCIEQRVPLTESLVELLTPTVKDNMAEGERVLLLQRLGETLQEQGEYHAATKKFTQAGDRVRAMKSLLKSGDTDKIIFFASMSRQKDIYIMAANYLQALNWQGEDKILKNIITFYTKGQAYNQLANFYTICAQVEIDEFRNYEKALRALQEAVKSLSRSAEDSQPAAQDTLHLAMAEVRHVIELQDAFKRQEYSNVIKLIKVRLEERHELPPPMRVWDLLALLVECLVAVGQHSEALYYVRELAQRKPDWYHRELLDKVALNRLVAETSINLEPYVNVSKVKRPTTATISTMSDDEEIQEICE